MLSVKEMLEQSYGYLFEAELIDEIEEVGTYKEVPQGERLIEIGDYIKMMPLVLEGAIKILREDENGDELLLYFIEKSDTCAMTFSCCLGNKKSEIRAVAETDTKLLFIPVQQMDIWMSKYKSWQRYILDSYHIRMMELLETVDTLAFLRMDERLLKHLQDKAKVSHDDVIHTTHQDIAYDLHTSRVVVSRLLKQLEKEGKIEMHRNKIKVLEL
ncbi:CRP/FNR family transcriptional regulator [Saonia flava]|uniref:CRP/FNR family transcriptional regulator n=1 Tax=Saonia flava TaxID=523696 RepID=A0A846R2N4_9FLAO|nr:Crp/Fnr family transcriptional regulator [Saonia flava]NJB72673.1 CRP/FNR family transcriptional regulator [Saonia flava]